VGVSEMIHTPSPSEWLEVFFEREKDDEIKSTIGRMITELKTSFPDLSDLALSLFPLGYLYSLECSKWIFHYHPVETMEALAKNMPTDD
jgi:hypothetical protein